MKQKSLGLDDFTKIPVGANGIEERLSVVWNQGVVNGKMSHERFVAATSSDAAKLFGLYPDKGYIDVGSHADVVIWDPEALSQISADNHISKSDYNIFEGMDIKGKADTVILGGRIVLLEGQLKAVAGGHGRFLPLSPYPVHVYDKIKSRQVFKYHPVERKDHEDLDTGAGDIPPPQGNPLTPEKAPSLHISNIEVLFTCKLI